MDGDKQVNFSFIGCQIEEVKDRPVQILLLLPGLQPLSSENK